MKSLLPSAGLKGVLLKGAGAFALAAMLAACSQNPTPLDRPDDVPASFEQPSLNAQAPLWHQRWRMFWMACAELFGHDQGREWMVVHHLLGRAS